MFKFLAGIAVGLALAVLWHNFGWKLIDAVLSRNVGYEVNSKKEKTHV